MKKEVILCMDIGGTNCRIGLCGRDYTLYEKQIVSTEQMASNGFLSELVALLHRFLERFSASYAIMGISLGFPATIDKARRVVLQAPAIEGASGLKVCDVLEKEFGLPVFLEKDVNLLLQFDLMDLKLPTEGVLIGIYFGTGIGNSVYVDGKPLFGRNGVAGELGHIPQLFADRVCGCGNIGCLEPLGGGKRLSELCKTAFPETQIRAIYREHGDTEAVRRQVDAMAVAVATEVNILDPEYVVLGGGLLQMEGFPLAYFEKKIRTYVRKPYPERNLRLVYSRADQENGIIGAGIYGWMRRIASQSCLCHSDFCDSVAAASVGNG